MKDIRKLLGVPARETTWVFEDTMQPLLKYKVGDGGIVNLYVHKERVILVSFDFDATP